ncbi:MAG: hypothetical protein PHO63_04835 [Bacilli bacterium]|nr:hypothetical protein [Bacilli bacterium]MDD4808799.1 hypothetical protein [Bacilli bacterium]
MKNKVIASVILIGLFAVGFLVANAQSVSAEQNDIKITYTEKSIYDNKEDGWFYGFEIAYAKSDKTRSYIFDGFNLKYKESDDYYISYKNKETGEEIQKIPSKYATLSTSKEYREEIKEINKFFNKKQFDKTISLSDLEELNIAKISKEYLVDLFNRTINSEMKTIPGKYFEAPFLDKETQVSSDENVKGKWQVSYLLDYGKIHEINIEFIDGNGNYLSDVEKNKSASVTEKAMFDDVQEIEKSIIKSQKIESNLATEKNATYSDLNKLLNNLSKKLITNE